MGWGEGAQALLVLVLLLLLLGSARREQLQAAGARLRQLGLKTSSFPPRNTELG